MRFLKKIGLIIGGLIYTIIYPCLMTLLISVPYLWLWDTHSFWTYIIMFCIEFGLLIYLLAAASLFGIMPLKTISELDNSLEHITKALIVFGIIMSAIIYGCSIYYLFTVRPFGTGTFNLLIVSIAHVISFFLSFAVFKD